MFTCLNKLKANYFESSIEQEILGIVTKILFEY